MATVLVVDDEAAIRDVLGKILVSQGHRVVEAADADAALVVLGLDKPDLAFIDLVMPGKGGMSLIMESLAHLPGLAIIAMSGRIPLQGDSLAGFSAQFGVSCFLAKPFDPEAVRDAAAKALAGRCS